MYSNAAGISAVSEDLRAFVEEMPYERRSIVAFVHEQSREADLIATVDALPHQDATIEAVLLTHVLEYVADPAGARWLGYSGRAVP